jgi:hypothetical protein
MHRFASFLSVFVMALCISVGLTSPLAVNSNLENCPQIVRNKNDAVNMEEIVILIQTSV